MNCPKCGSEMTTGELRLHRSHLAKVVFSPKGKSVSGAMSSIAPRFVKVLPSQTEINFHGSKWSVCVAHDKAHRCPDCQILVVEDV